MSTLLNYLWQDVKTNPLAQATWGTPKSLKITRLTGLIFTTICTLWTIIPALDDQPYLVISYLTDISVFTCNAYFILVHFSQNDPDSGKRWKYCFVIGEIAASFEFLVAPFYWAFLFSPGGHTFMFMLKDLCVHFGCTVAIWVETLQNGISFPSSHRYIVIAAGLLYMVDNLLWSVYNAPVYDVITWDNGSSYVYLGIAAVLMILGFEVGRLQYRKKSKKQETLITQS